VRNLAVFHKINGVGNPLTYRKGKVFSKKISERKPPKASGKGDLYRESKIHVWARVGGKKQSDGRGQLARMFWGVICGGKE